MGIINRISHEWRAFNERRFERYIQSAIKKYRYDPKPTIAGNGTKIENVQGHGAILSYCPSSNKLLYFSSHELDPALVRIAETMLVINRLRPKTAAEATKPYVVTSRDITFSDGPVDNQMWFDYMDALVKLMPEKAMVATKQAILKFRKDQHLTYAWCRIFQIPTMHVRLRARDCDHHINHVTSFIEGLIQLKKELNHEPARSAEPSLHTSAVHRRPWQLRNKSSDS